MSKRLAVVSGALSVTVFIISVVACSSDNESNTFTENPEDASFDQGKGFNTDGNTTGQDVVGPVTCSPSLPSTFKPEWKPPTKASACSSADVAGYYDACLGNISVPDAGGICTQWKADHKQCGDCIETDANNGPIQFYRNRLYYVLNVAGCLSIERNEPEAGKCAATYSDSIECQRASCNDCLLQDGAQFSAFQDCQKKAKETACNGYEGKRGTACGTTYNDPDGGAWDCFKHGTEDQKVHFSRVITLFCGQ